MGIVANIRATTAIMQSMQRGIIMSVRETIILLQAQARAYPRLLVYVETNQGDAYEGGPTNCR